MTDNPDHKVVDALRAAMRQVERLRRENRQLQAGRAPEPLAIVGMSCRFPGGVRSPQDLWQVVADGRDVVGEFPIDRGWAVDALFDPEPGVPGKSYTRSGGFLDGVAEFDAAFFDISPREAVGMDPRQRLLLEVSWEALESAGIDPETLHGSAAGVFVGVASPQEYAAPGYGIPATAASVVSGRVAYVLGLEGPAVTVDTACSSSLVALHQAGLSLRAGECELALVGGVTVMASPEVFVEFSLQGGLSADGRCKSFAKAADGTGWAEGVGVLVVERLSDAQRNGHEVLAVVRGSAVNQDGASNGLTAPNGPSQQRVIRAALANAGLSATDVDVIEAHGTGTRLGDPIEAQAILATYGQDRPADRPLWLGSIKSNIGHTQAAAGVAGVIKMVEAMRHGVLPKTLHVDEPTPHVDWTTGRVELLTEQAPWSELDRPRRAGVSSFGISGTNAHVILEQAPATASEPVGGPLPIIPWVISARTAQALAAQAAQLLGFAESRPESVSAQVGAALSRRTGFEHRAVVLGGDRAELLAGLADIADGRAVLSGRTVAPGRIVFVFPGQGSQWLGMGRELLAESSVFAERMSACERALAPWVRWSLLEVVREGDEELLARVDVVQPVLWAVMVSLAAVWESLGVKPSAVVGHSQGEIAAACVAGVLSLEDAARVVAVRSRLLTDLPQRGGMAAVALSEESVRTRLIDGVGIAAINGPAAIVVSGPAQALDEFVTGCEADGVQVRRLPVDYASHSGQVDAVRAELVAALDGIDPRSVEVEFFSSVTGDRLDGSELKAQYWFRNLRSTVRFEAATRALLTQGWSMFIETSTHPALLAAIHDTYETVTDDTIRDRGIATVASLRRDDGGWAQLLGNAADAWINGIPVTWHKLFEQAGVRRIPLPTYAFQHQRYWTDAISTPADLDTAGMRAARHPLLAAVVAVPDFDGIRLTGQLSVKAQPWLAEHAVFGRTLLPGAAFVELAIRAGDEIGCPVLRELTLTTPLLLDQGPVQLHVVVGDRQQVGRSVRIYSRPDAEQAANWRLHAEGVLAEYHSIEAIPDETATWPPPDAEPVPLDQPYETLLERGYQYGPCFQGLQRLWRHGAHTYADIELPDGTDATGFRIHPVLLDAVLHAALLTTADVDRTPLPYTWTDTALYATGATSLRARIVTTDPGVYTLRLTDTAGQPVLAATLRTRPVTPGQLPTATGPLYQLDWLPAEFGGPATLSQLEWDAAGDDVAEIMVTRCTPPETGMTDRLASATKAISATLRRWLTDTRYDRSTLLVITQGAVAVTGTESIDPVAAAVWGLVRAAQTEHPSRFVLVDTDDQEFAQYFCATAATAGEPEIALRGRQARIPRLRPMPPLSPSAEAAFGAGTVLITGGTGGLGAIVARHLVRRHGIRHVVLTSRSGMEAAGAAELVAELAELGARVEVAACDVADRAALARLLAPLRLSAVVHLAGVLDDGLVDTITPEQIAKVLAPKAEGAWHLHELTADAGLAAFVVFSSVAGVLGGAGQANYAAANRFLDGLIAYRRERGLPGISIAWGLWAEATSMTAHVSADRFRHTGIAPMSAEQGTSLLDDALAADAPLVVAARVDTAALHAQAAARQLPPMLSALVPNRRAIAHPGPAEPDLRGRLHTLDVDRRFDLVLELCRTHAATVLGHSASASIEPGQAFKELGFDSLAAVRFRNRLGAATGLNLPSSLVFDHPTPRALTRFLIAELIGDQEPERRPVPVRARRDEPLAIVGMGCRFPGGVGSPSDLWRLMAEGRDVVGEFPTDRGWDVETLFDPQPGVPGKTYTRSGGFLDGIAEFDAAFFGISPHEAVETDPQQRQLLEVTWEALESAGIDPASLRGTDTGVFTGLMYHDYPASDGKGSIASGRVSYVLGLEGPAVTVDTACSSSLVALHQAGLSLRAGECELALVGGVTVMASPNVFVEFSLQGGLSADGRCKPFAEAADGTGWAEGVGVLVVERLSDAQRNGHEVLAVVRGSAVNQDGASNGLTAPNGPSQQRVIRAALANAGLDASDVDAVEAHGTGTTLGDPIEAQAILATYGQDRHGDRPLWLGSIKSNFGHTQAAAGVAGVIKMVEAMRHGVLPQTLHVNEPSPHVDWTTGHVALLTEQQPWPDDKPRRAGVSSFGISGTNAHVILEQAPAEIGAPERNAMSVVPWLISARSRAALAAQCARLLEFATARPELDAIDIGASLARRSEFEYRAVLLGADRAELLSRLAAANTETPARHSGRIVFVFPGQGSQWLGMGRELLAESSVFAERMSACERALAPWVRWSLLEVVREGDEELLARVDVVQPVLWAVMVSLAAVWESLGVKPSAVVGHSQGEIAAACVAGVLSLEDAARVVAVRSRLLTGLDERGGMAAVALSEQAVGARLNDGLSIAAINGPTATVVSGPAQALDEFVTGCEADEVQVRRLPVDYASHSTQVDQVRSELVAALHDIDPHASEVAFFSSVTGDRLDGSELKAQYWFRNLRSTVRFEAATRALLTQGWSMFIETSTHPALLAAIHDTYDATTHDVSVHDRGLTTIASLRRDDGSWAQLLGNAADAWINGIPVTWHKLFEQAGARRIPLPTYAFQHQRYWTDNTTGTPDLAAAGIRPTEHPLLAAAIHAPETDGLRLTGRLSLTTQPWLTEHAVFGRTLLPGAAFVELAIRAGDEIGCPVLRELTLTTPLLLDQGPMQLQVVVGGREQPEHRSIQIYARLDSTDSAPWQLHARGLLTAQHTEIPTTELTWPPTEAHPVQLDAPYSALAERGYHYGPAFQGLQQLWRHDEQVYAEIELPADTDTAGFGIHPALLDAVLHAALLTTADTEQTPLPYTWTDTTLHAAGATRLRAHLATVGPDTYALRLTDPAGQLVLTATLHTRPITPQQLHTANHSLHHLRWIPLAQDKIQSLDTEVRVVELTEFAAQVERLGDTAPDVVVLRCPTPADPDDDAVLPDVHAVTHRILAALQVWLDDERFVGTRLVVETRGAVATPGAPVEDLAAAAVWGLVSSAQSEYRDRILLVDTDTATEPAEYLGVGEDRLAIRAGRVLAPRIVTLDTESAPEADPFAVRLDSGTVVVTGGTAGLGAVLARHLVLEHAVRSLLLVSRRGPQTPGVDGLIDELTAAGALVRVVAADVADRESLRQALTAVPDDAPLVGVVHAAGVLDDALLSEQSAPRMDAVFAPKVDGAWHLHDLTAHADLALFVVFSSVAGVLGAPGQANYAAANRFLDGLASYRRARGLVATSLAWGLWAAATGMTGRLCDADLGRLSRAGLAAMTREHGLALFDEAVRADADVILAARWNLPELRARAAADTLPRILADLAPKPRAVAARAQGASAQTGDLAGLDEKQRFERVLDIVRARVAIVLGHADAASIESGQAFKDLGFDSLDAVAFRDQLEIATGVRLPASAVFDYPTPLALARYLVGELTGNAPRERAPAPTATRSDDPLAIVGMACRFPGGASSPEHLWDIVARGLDVMGGFPDDRGWDLEELYDPEPGVPGKSYVREGGFLHEAGRFDPGFFGITPREAVGMDPQQRQLLEVSWEALESAGIDPKSLRGSATGVFAGVASPQGYRAKGYGIPAIAASVASGRVSYVLGLEGPAVTVDTACSSSLVALHQAGLSLRAGECELALVGGVTVMASPEVFVEFSLQGGLSADGRCKSFAKAADGTGWAEGVGVLVVERLSDAQRNGHEVLAVVRGSAVNQDGASNGLTAPNGPSQQRVIRTALANSGLNVGDVDAVEAHGTGTTLGDPIEAQAILATYGQRDRSGAPLWLGSIKSNMGHTQAAAGVAGVIKMVEAMRHGVLPKTLHVNEPSPHVDWTTGHVALLTEQQPWPDDKPRRAGVSSFGISGTNAHVILEQAPAEAPKPTGAPLPVIPWVISARTPQALAEQAARLHEFVAARDELDAVDVGMAAAGRTPFEHRAVVLGVDRAELLSRLAAVHTETPMRHSGRTVFVFPGQGSQRLGMGRELYEAYPAFATAWDTVTKHFDSSLREIVWGADPDALEQTAHAQAALFTVEVALFRLLESWGAVPDLVIGHSVGEIAAAHVAGVLSLADATALVAARGRLMQALPVGGAMVAVQADEDTVRQLLVSGVDLAAVNSPHSVVLSGAAEQVAGVVARLTEQGRRTKRLAVSHAFHSAAMEPMLAEFAAAIAGITPAVPTIPIATNSTGELAAADYGSSDYWVRHVRQTVRFADGIATLREQGVVRFVEIGPESGLSAAITECVDDTLTVPTLRKHRSEPESLLEGLARMFVAGQDVNWPRLFDGAAARRIALPTYAFQHQNYWLPGMEAGDAADFGLIPIDHPLLAGAMDSPRTAELTFTGTLSSRTQPWLAEHAITGRTLLPGTAFVELALRVGREVGCAVVRELTLSAPLPLDRRGARIRVVIGADTGGGERPVAIYSRPPDDTAQWQQHAEGVLTEQDSLDPARSDTRPPAQAERIDTPDTYAYLADRGYEYGPAFRGMLEAWRHGDERYAEAVLPSAADPDGYAMHPALLDALLHAILLGGARDDDSLLMPFDWRDVRVHDTGATHVHARIVPTGADTVRVEVSDETGRPVLDIGELRSRPVAVAQLNPGAGARLFVTRWVPRPQTATAAPGVVSVVEATEPAAVPGRKPVVPDTVIVEYATGTGESIADTHALAHEILATLQTWLTDPRCERSRLIVVTRDVIDTEAGAPASLPGAALWGLVSAAQAEYPNRIGLVDLASGAELDAASIARCTEPQAALRKGRQFVPRLTTLAQAPMPGPALDSGTVLVTGGTGGLGAVLARHLVTEYGVRSLLLLSRRGPAAPGVDDLLRELAATGARVRAVAADVADRESLRQALATVPDDMPLVGVVHTAGVLDDAVLVSQSRHRIDTVFAPKVDGAWHLHELLADTDLAMFVLYSSVSGTIGAAGQANYAAANRFLDALAAHRRASGRVGTSIAWGLWAETTGMTGHLAAADVDRFERAGIAAMARDRALDLFDRAVRTDTDCVVAARWDPTGLRARAAADLLPPILADLVPAQPLARNGSRPGPAALRKRLHGLAPTQQRDAVLDLVRTNAGVVLGRTDTDAIDPDQAFKDIGFDSLSAVEFRNRLTQATGLKLPAGVVFDQPTPAALSTYLHEVLLEQNNGFDGTPVGSVDELLDRLDTVLARAADKTGRTRVLRRLHAITTKWGNGAASAADDIDSASGDELLAIIDREL
ncbi:SDR family NAD(P)-dependent oxidoreductase [Nocardia sp. CA-135953]|uniref:SDR family NAD(P)-dependent oxidoreductase n=1 Tax=Nocardia sp. CA-135953 TaxID=3239978 RepID=UPI003D966710